MAEIPLLHACAKERTETGDVSSGALEAGYWLSVGIVFKIVVGAELLIARDLVVEADRKLIATLAAVRTSYQLNITWVGQFRTALRNCW